MIYVKLIVFSILMASGQVLFKQAALKLGSTLSFASLATNYWLISAIFLYGCATILWVLILRSMPLNLAYPFMALGFVIVPLAAYFIFREGVSFYYILGSCLIVSGIILTQLKG